MTRYSELALAGYESYMAEPDEGVAECAGCGRWFDPEELNEESECTECQSEQEDE